MIELALDDLTDRVAFTDPASGKQEVKRVKAQQAIVVVGQDALTRIFVLYAWAGRLPTTEYAAKILQVNDDWRPRSFGIEANAMQSLFADLVIRDAQKVQKRVSFIPVHQPTKIDKDFRISTGLQPIIARGRLFLLNCIPPSQGMRALFQQLEGFPNILIKDLADCLESACALLPKRTTVQRRTEEAENLAAYLRETGGTPAYIEQRLREIENGQA